MAKVVFSARAYCKMILHANKYPHCAVNGLLLGRLNKDKDELLLVDVVPLFHICLQVSPMAEIALTQVDQVALNADLNIVGYYVANEIIDDFSTERAANRIAEKIAENFAPACFVVLNNQQLTLGMSDHGVILSQFKDGKWLSKEAWIDDELLDTAAVLLQKRASKALVDFDNHLDDISQDWRNKHLNTLIEEVASLP